MVMVNSKMAYTLQLTIVLLRKLAFGTQYDTQSSKKHRSVYLNKSLS